MPLPDLNPIDIQAAIPRVQWLGKPQRGGQKVVYPCKIAGAKYALKIMLSNQASQTVDEEYSEDTFDEVTERARREVSILGECDTPHLVKLGPVPLTSAIIGGQNVVYFTEEWIDGNDLSFIVREEGVLSSSGLVRLGLGITDAVKALWALDKIHRDIKPGNIMRRTSDGEYVLLDMGLALDLTAESLTTLGAIPGTMQYFSPEQIQYAKKRQMDFRSDLFALGVVLYQAATRQHPFWQPGMSSQATFAAIIGNIPPRPSTINSSIPAQMDDVIVRLLEKQPHLRYRSCDRLIVALRDINMGTQRN